MPELTILKVAVAVPVYTIFDYLPPVGCDPRQLAAGIRLVVPFGKGELCGVLLQATSDTSLRPSRLKRVSAVLDDRALLSSEDLWLLNWAAEYYHHPLGEVINNALPTRLRKGGKPVSDIRVGWRLTQSGSALDPESLTRAPRQKELLRLLSQSPDGLAVQEIYRHCGACRHILQRLAQRGWIESAEIPSEGDAAQNTLPTAGLELNEQQQSAVDQVMGRLSQFDIFLLDGVTGSGKTEVYLTLLSRVIAGGGSALVLVPEIGLTPQLLTRFQARLQIPIAVLHSGLSESDREMAWHQARLGRVQVVIGTRSSVFVPMSNLRLVIVDEEHDLSFKQQDGFRYSARDVAVVRAKRSGCPVILGSATPSLESLRNAEEGRYMHLRLPYRAGGAEPPRVDLLDIRSAKLEAGVAPLLIRMIESELSAGNQVLLFLNRRGYAPILTCHDCGWVAQCQRCDSRMTVHLADNQLLCHHCGKQYRIPHLCQDCARADLRTLGQGTERVEEMLKKRFPDTALVRIDRDTTRRKDRLQNLLGEIKDSKHSLLLGTQMLAKGHHFPNVTLVGVLDVDQALFGADFRAAERMAQLIVQVSGRAGRADKPGRVLIQTRHPDHPLLQTLLHSGYAEFALESLRERRLALLPPYSFQALLRAEAHSKELPLDFLSQCVESAATIRAKSVDCFGPVPAPMERRAGRYRFQLLLQSDKRSALQAFLATWLPRITVMKSARRVRWSIDVDPLDML